MIKIVAELAQGYEGKPEQTYLLLLAGARAGADAVKLQLVYAEELCTSDYKDFKLFSTLEMPDEIWQGLAKSARELNVELHLDVFGLRSLALAESIGAQAVKIHGTDMGNIGLLQAVAKTNVPTVLLGAGGAFASEIEQAVKLLPNKQVVVLLGFQGYPTLNDANQIARVRTVSDLYSNQPNVTVGFADHASPGDVLSTALAATALGAGATVFEKHLTLGQVMKLEDHEAALNPDQFAEFACALRDCSVALGEANVGDDFGMSSSELGYRQWTRKHVVARRPIKNEEVISPDAVVLKRTPSKDALTSLESVYGQRAMRDIEVDHSIAQVDVSNDGAQS